MLELGGVAILPDRLGRGLRSHDPRGVRPETRAPKVRLAVRRSMRLAAGAVRKKLQNSNLVLELSPGSETGGETQGEILEVSRGSDRNGS